MSNTQVKPKVRWDDTFGRRSGRDPRWTTLISDSALEQAARERLSLSAEARCKVTFFLGGPTKVYTVDTDSGTYLMHVPLPIEPRWKTLSEVATLVFVRQHCTDLVPKVLAYDANADNPVGFEWTILEKLPGMELDRLWPHISWDAKISLLKEVARIMAKLYAHQLNSIGSIYPERDTSTHVADTPTVGRIVSRTFFWDTHFAQNVSRGPFRSSHDWLAARLAFTLNDAAETMRTSKYESAREEAKQTQEIASDLLRLLPKFFPAAADDPPEATAICHPNFALHNLLVDRTGSLTGIVHWECATALPLWKACQIPPFLVSRARSECPDLAAYRAEYPGMSSGTIEHLYDMEFSQWERTQLRAHFFEEMAHVQPRWVEQHHASQRQADFDIAVKLCDDSFILASIRKWVDEFDAMSRGETSEYVSLSALIYG